MVLNLYIIYLLIEKFKRFYFGSCKYKINHVGAVVIQFYYLYNKILVQSLVITCLFNRLIWTLLIFYFEHFTQHFFNIVGYGLQIFLIGILYFAFFSGAIFHQSGNIMQSHCQGDFLTQTLSFYLLNAY